MLIVNYYIGVLIFSLFIAVFVLLCALCKSKDKLFFNEVIQSVDKMKERHWETYPVTNDNKKLLAKKIQRFLEYISNNNTGVKALTSVTGNDVNISIVLKSIWVNSPHHLSQPKE